MVDERKDTLKNAFRLYLTDKCKGNLQKVDAVMHCADELLPGFVSIHLDDGFGCIYDITDANVTLEYQDQISLNPILKAEDQSMEEVGYTDCLTHYRRFLKSKYHPNHQDYVKPAPVPAERQPAAGGDEAQPDVPVTTDEELSATEGGMKQIPASAEGHERNPELRRMSIEAFKKANGGRVFCECCGFDFSVAYGELGQDYIEVHHTKPFSQATAEAGGEHRVLVSDMVLLCSNCHSMIHRVGRKGDCMTVAELREKHYRGIDYKK